MTVILVSQDAKTEYKMKEKSCAIMGPEPLKFPWGYDEEAERCGALKLILLNMVNFWLVEKIKSFVVVLDAGIGLYAAEIISELKEKDSEISLTCVVPWEEQAAKWPPDLRERYYNVQARCDETETVSSHWTASCEVEAKLRAIDGTERVFAVRAKEEDTLLEVALHYARRTDKNVLIFDSEKIDFQN